MIAMRKTLSIFVLFATLTLSLGQIQHNSEHHINLHSEHRLKYGPHHKEIILQKLNNNKQENVETDEDDIQEDITPEEKQMKRQVEISEIEDQEDFIPETDDQGINTSAARNSFWTTCDFLAQPIKSCYDCNNIVICKPIGGLVYPCGSPYRPYCNNGVCSSIPGAEC